jgi:hypothetical protein
MNTKKYQVAFSSSDYLGEDGRDYSRNTNNKINDKMHYTYSSHNALLNQPV